MENRQAGSTRLNTAMQAVDVFLTGTLSHLRTVLRDRPVRRAMSLYEKWSR